MTKDLVEKYQQILENDPGSLVFMELAKALLDRNSASKAVQVCENGLEHHPDSIEGRVLLGKALISSGRPAEAMAQFDKAVSIDRENPLAYNLISETLLQKKLYRSALPIIKKASNLQPDNPRVQQWLEQVQRAIGVPVTSPTAAGSRSSRSNPAVASLDARTNAASNQPIAGGAQQAFESDGLKKSGYAEPGSSDAAVRSSSGISAEPPGYDPYRTERFEQEWKSNGREAGVAGTNESSSQIDGSSDSERGIDRAGDSSVQSSDRDPIGQFGRNEPTLSGSRIGGQGSLELVSDEREKTKRSRNQVIELDPVPEPSLERHATPPPAPLSAIGPARPIIVEESSASPQSVPVQTPIRLTTADRIPVTGQNLGQPLEGLAPKFLESPEFQGSRISPDTAPTLIVDRSRELARKTPVEVAAPPPIVRDRLLPELPTSLPSPLRRPVDSRINTPVMNEPAADEIAREYERELREQLLSAPPPTFWHKNWLVISLGVLLILAGAVSFFVYKATRAKNRDRDLANQKSQAFRALTFNTPAGYRNAIELSTRVLGIAEDDKDAKAILAYSNAMLYKNSGQEAAQKDIAEKYLIDIREKHPALVLVIRYLIADASGVENAKKQVIDSPPEQLPANFEGAELLSLAGRLLLASNRSEEALAKFQAAIKADSSHPHVPTLLALGDYYRSQSDYDRALDYLNLAKTASPEHILPSLGIAAAKLEMPKEKGNVRPELEKAKSLFQSLEGTPAAWPASIRCEIDLIEGRLLAQEGKMSDALVKLDPGLKEHSERRADFYAASGAVQARTGNFREAADFYRRALHQRPSDPAIKEELARAHIAEGLPNEAIKITDGIGADDRRLRIVRGLARIELGQFQKAREEFTATKRGENLPAEAAIYMAVALAATGQADVGKRMLEDATSKALKKGAIHVALGKILMDEGKQSDAVSEWNAAESDPLDWEGACSLGRYLLKTGRYTEALQHLEMAVERNKQHLEARLALGQTLLALGEVQRAQTELEAVVTRARFLARRASAELAGPLSSCRAAALRSLARSLLTQGMLDEARKNAREARELEPKDIDGARLEAQINLAAGDVQTAIRGLDRVARMNPRDAAIWCDLGEILEKSANPNAAWKAYDAALKIDRNNHRARLGVVAVGLPRLAKKVVTDSDVLVNEVEKNPALKARALALNARAYLALGDKRRAVATARRAVQTYNASADAHLAQAFIAIAGKEDAQAIKELTATLSSDQSIAEAHLWLAALLVNDATQTKRSLSEYEAYLRIAPNGGDAPVVRKAVAAMKAKARQAARP